jgi:ubiquinol-cytochrome c reductase iron-sulfur subunit
MPNLRRLYLKVTLKLLLLLGLALAAIPFIASLHHSDNGGQSAANPWYVEVDLSRLAPGQWQSVPWPGGEVWVYARTLDEIQALQTADTERLRDPDSRHSQQPVAASNVYRSLHPDYFVFLPRETRRGCQVQQIELPAGINGYTEACYGARFDNAGRIFRDSGQPDQHNLSVPPHEFIEVDRLRLLPVVP